MAGKDIHSMENMFKKFTYLTNPKLFGPEHYRPTQQTPDSKSVI